MELHDIRRMAVAEGIRGCIDWKSKPALIRAIQRSQGQDPCFAGPGSAACQADCPWQDDCQRPIAAWQR